VALAAVLGVCAAGSANAQYVSGLPRRGSVEIGAAVTLNGGRTDAPTSATETSNPIVSSTPLTLFRAQASLEPAVGIEGRVGVYLTPAVELEGAGSFTRPVLAVRLTGDFEGAVDTTADETSTQYLIGGSALYHFGRGRLQPFVFGGAAFLRQLDAGGVDAQNGTELHAGGGMKYWFGHGRRRTGLRADGRVSSRDKSGGLDPTKRITLPVVSAGVVVNF
jgi:hypothetical protein